jgi:hypothetical protein
MGDSEQAKDEDSVVTEPPETKQVDLEGAVVPDMGSEGRLSMAFVVADIISHEKGDKRSICLFAEVKKDGERIGTINLNINNLKKEGIDFLNAILKAKVTRKTPLVGELFIPTGAILDHWNLMKPEEKE